MHDTVYTAVVSHMHHTVVAQRIESAAALSPALSSRSTCCVLSEPEASMSGSGAPPSSKRQRVSPPPGGGSSSCSSASFGASSSKPAVQVRETPSGSSGRSHTRSIEDLRWHFPMINDHERNAKYCTAVETAVARARRVLRARGETRGVRVLDIGAGSGLLALAAARAGAEHVTACEADPLVAGAASEVIEASGYAHCVTLVALHSSQLSVGDMREGLPADVVTHELLDSTLLGEDVVPALRDAYARGLALPGAASVPWGARIEAQLVTSKSLRARRHPPASLWSESSGETAARSPRGALAEAAAECPAGRAAQGVEASAWIYPVDATVATAVPALRTIGEHQDILLFEFAAPPSAAGRAVECLFKLPSGSVGPVDGVVYWWLLYLLPPGEEPAPHEATAKCAAGMTSLTVLSTRPAVGWVPREHWWQACCLLPMSVELKRGEDSSGLGVTPQELRLTASHNDASVWFDLVTTERALAPPEVIDGAWRCSCPSGLHTEWSSQRLTQLADSSRQQRYRQGVAGLLKEVHRANADEDDLVILAFGVWMAVQAARALVLLQTTRETHHSVSLHVVVIEGSPSARRLAAAVLEAQEPPLPTGLVEICEADWGRFVPAVHLRGRRIAAVVAEPWFRGTGNSWGPGAVVQFQAMCASLPAPAPRCFPQSAAIRICAVECGALAAGQRPVGSVCGFDLSAFNGLRPSSHYSSVVGVPLWAHPHQRLTQPATAQTYQVDRSDGAAADAEDGSVVMVELPIVRDGACHGIVLWVDTTLTAEGDVEPGSADAARPYQRQGLRLLQEPQLVRAGETLSVMVRRCAGGTRLELDVLP